MTLTETLNEQHTGGPVVRIDGSRPLSAELVAELSAVCDQADDGAAVVRVLVSGTPGESWTTDLDVSLVSKWERTLRRLERLAATTVAVAEGDCGGPALDALLATDFRIATTSVRLMVPVDGGATWPGMAVYRLSQQAGVARIRRAVMFGRPIEAVESVTLHLVDELVDDQEAALAAVAELAASFSGAELAIRRRLLLDASSTSFEDALGSHLAACDRTLRGTGA